ncbi:MAG: signal peptidase I [Candidatus Coproplasma sp.]
MTVNKTDKKEEKGAKKVFSIILTVLTVLIFLLATYILINIIVCRVKNKPVSLFGTSFAIVQTGSMEPDIKVGDLIVFRSVKYNNIKVGDVIVFTADESFDTSMRGCTIVHQVIGITDEGLVTKGVHNLSQDGGFREANEVLGLCVYNSAGWGAVFSFLSKYGILILIAVISIPVITKLIIKIVKLSKEGDEGEKPKEVDGESGAEDNAENEGECNSKKDNE